MQCPRCQHENPRQVRSSAGRAPHRLPRCVHPVARPTRPRINSAGNAPRRSGASRLRSPLPPSSYTPKHLAEKILTSEERPRGRAQAGHRALLRHRGLLRAWPSGWTPRRCTRSWTALFDSMAEAVHRYEGTVNQFLGDGLMALFGAPVALEDHALRAVQAALAIRETLSGYSEQLKRERGVDLQPAPRPQHRARSWSGRIGDDLRMDYTAVGDTTHLAARMQALAEPGTILDHRGHASTRRRIRPQRARWGRSRSKGRSEPVRYVQGDRAAAGADAVWR